MITEKGFQRWGRMGSPAEVRGRGQGIQGQGQFCHWHRREGSKDGTVPERVGVWRWEYEGGPT